MRGREHWREELLPDRFRKVLKKHDQREVTRHRESEEHTSNIEERRPDVRPHRESGIASPLWIRMNVTAQHKTSVACQYAPTSSPRAHPQSTRARGKYTHRAAQWRRGRN